MGETVRCPNCGAQAFANMDICYECLSPLMVARDGVESVETVDYEDAPMRDHRWRIRVEAPGAVFFLDVPPKGIVFGRGEGCDVMLRAPSVSRKHLEAKPGPGGMVVRDLGARNPATLRGQPIQEEAAWEAGESIRLCNTSLTLLEPTGI